MSCSASLCGPIEWEPRTLNQGQISHAREAAATTIFTEGLKPVQTSKEMKRSIGLAGVRDHYEGGGDVESHEEKERRKKEKPCQCSCVIGKIKEPVSSPF